MSLLFAGQDSRLEYEKSIRAIVRLVQPIAFFPVDGSIISSFPTVFWMSPVINRMALEGLFYGLYEPNIYTPKR